MTAGPVRTLVFIHPSDELYGADRMLLEFVGALPDWIDAEVWLPTDTAHPKAPLCHELEGLGVRTRHLDLPILRRAYRTPRALARLAVKVRRTARELRLVAPDAVYCTTSAAYLNIHSAARAKVPVIIGHVQEFWSSSDRLVLAPLARRAHLLIAISDSVAGALPPAVRARARVVPNATPDPGPVIALGGRSGPLRFVIASRWNGWKGHRTLLAAWDRAGCPGHLTVLGGPPPVGQAVDVVALRRDLADPESVRIVGEVNDVGRYLTEADVVLMPSDDPEPFGLVAVEAFARARPVIASAAGGLAEIVTPGHDGWLFPSRDDAALAAVLRGLTRGAVELAGKNARETYESRFTVERYAREWSAALTAPGGIAPPGR